MDPRLMHLVVIGPVLTMLAGCSTFGAPASGSLCPVGPFITDPGAAERLTRAEKEYQVALNEAGREICGWQPPKRGQD